MSITGAMRQQRLRPRWRGDAEGEFGIRGELFPTNRVRMIAAMFLTKDLFIDWRLGERYFMQHLVDGDFCQQQRRLAVVRLDGHRRGAVFSHI